MKLLPPQPKAIFKCDTHKVTKISKTAVPCEYQAESKPEVFLTSQKVNKKYFLWLIQLQKYLNISANKVTKKNTQINIRDKKL